MGIVLLHYTNSGQSNLSAFLLAVSRDDGLGVSGQGHQLFHDSGQKARTVLPDGSWEASLLVGGIQDTSGTGQSPMQLKVTPVGLHVLCFTESDPPVGADTDTSGTCT